MRLLPRASLTLCALISAATLLPASLQTSQAQEVSVMPNYYYEMSTVRPEDGEDGDFIIRLMSPGAMTGCYTVSPADIEMIDAGAVMFIKLEEGKVELQKETSYDQFSCQMKAGSQYIDIPLNKNDLAESDTNKISITSKNVGKLYDVEVETDEHSITLNSELKTGARMPEEKLKTEIRHWFFPENTVIVFANNMDKNPEIAKKVKGLAGSRGLTPLGVEFKEFESPKNELYFLDTQNIMDDAFADQGTISIGSINLEQEYQGPNGPYVKTNKQTVFARKPNEQD